MLNRHQKRKMVHRSISDVSVGKSMWKNVASVMSNLRSGYSGSVYNHQSSKENLVIGKSQNNDRHYLFDVDDLKKVYQSLISTFNFFSSFRFDSTEVTEQFQCRDQTTVRIRHCSHTPSLC